MLRRILALAAVLLAAFFIFASCRKGEDPGSRNAKVLDQMSAQYDTTANITYGELGATATISQTTPTSCSVSFTAPDSLKDMAFTFTRDEVQVSFKGLSFAFDPSSVPGGAVANMAVSAINKVLLREDLDLDYTDGALSVSGNTDAGAFTLVLDPENGNMLSLSVPGEGLEIEFEDFRFLS